MKPQSLQTYLQLREAGIRVAASRDATKNYTTVKSMDISGVWCIADDADKPILVRWAEIG